MQIRQLNVSHDSTEDRLILRVATPDSEEIRAHLTRRFVGRIWSVLTTVLRTHLKGEQQPEAIMPASDEAKAAPKEPAGNFEEAFREDNTRFPLGRQPLLVSEAKIDVINDDLVRLTLQEGRDRSFTVNLNGELLQAFCAMLRAATARADWGLSLEYSASIAPKPAAPAPAREAALDELPVPAKSRLH